MATVTGADDPVNFYRADTIYDQLLVANSNFTGPTRIEKVVKLPDVKVGKESLPTNAIGLTFNDKTIGICQFVRPGVFRLRYDPQAKSFEDYPTWTSGNIDDTETSSLIRTLDRIENLEWDTELDATMMGDGYIIFRSRVNKTKNPLKEKADFTSYVELYLYTEPFRIQAVRELKGMDTSYLPPPVVIASREKPVPTVVWQTPGLPFKYTPRDDNNPLVNNVILTLFKPGVAQYLGFGEQGGGEFLKKPTYMNYFCYDNLAYSQVFGNKGGALNPEEPLYHSEPYFLELGGLPNFQNINATYVDNYSQVVIDLGKNNSDLLRIGTRFGQLDTYHFTADNLSEIIRLYTSIIGRTNLKPRYMLGHHQGCYGYESGDALRAVIDQYKEFGIPLDGLALDIDFQDQYRVFTLAKSMFNGNDPITYFQEFRQKGVKCCTNITPTISVKGGTNDSEYPTLKSGKEQKVFIPDRRSLTGTTANPWEVRYVSYDGGELKTYDPNDQSIRQPPDDYKFSEHYDKGYDESNPVYFHGGVYYGGERGTGAYYANLNLKFVRRWWGEQYRYLFDQGMEFIWQDMTTPTIAPKYGSMKAFPSRLQIPIERNSATKEAKSNWDKDNTVLKTAMEQWSLYPLNLHKATFEGLNTLRTNKRRNFIIGRGSGVGMFRYAALWTGDNVSTWDFWRITVAQVLSLGLGGVLSGSDAGGFLPNGSNKWCDPKLLIRWYAGSVGLPWLRNHYTKHDDSKYFQEPYAYAIHIRDPSHGPQEERWLYELVAKACRYYVRLRYSLLQLLYDALFEGQITGKPVARALLITDPLDTSLYNETRRFLDNEYVVRNDLLVAPVLEPDEAHQGRRDVYLPYPDRWYSFNLRPLEDNTSPKDFSIALQPPLKGGTIIYNYDASIYDSDPHIPYLTPMYVREGAIIPQIPVLNCVPDEGDNRQTPITLHIYPGKNRVAFDEAREYDDGGGYNLYLDDGFSRTSAVNPYALQHLHEILLPPQVKKDLGISFDRTDRRKNVIDRTDSENPLNFDNEAKNDYYHYQITQISAWKDKDDFKRIPTSRTITITNLHNGTGTTGGFNPATRFGKTFRVVVWYDTFKKVQDVQTISAKRTFKGKPTETITTSNSKDSGLNAVVFTDVEWPTKESAGIQLELS